MRIRQLDVLRFFAIFLVFGRHWRVSDLWYRFGWTGVDLFFVLSGFLVGGLLMREWRRHGEVRPGRFLIRRGFKIYPVFYFFIAASAGLVTVLAGRVPWARIVTESVFVQNYLPGLWPHTWSLAVEEHFYVLLPLLVLALAAGARDRADPFRALPAVFAVVALAALALRVWTSLAITPYSHRVHSFPTHLRIDSLLFGSVLAYAYTFHRGALTDRVRRLGPWIALCATACVLPATVIPIDAFFMHTLGFALLYVGFGSILLLALLWAPPVPGVLKAPLAPLGAAMAYVGRNSYAIYLWHFPVQKLLRPLVAGVMPDAAGFAIYIAGSMALGIVSTRLIERPSLRLRDRLFPSRSGDLEAPPAAPGPEAPGLAPGAASGGS